MPSTEAESSRDVEPIEVAVGILRDSEGRVLIGQRPPGKLYAGYWEFPGGKIEAEESVEGALRRELQEELGFELVDSAPLLDLAHRYPEYAVQLHVREVRGLSDRVRGREGQQLAWVAPDELSRWRLLPADGPIVSAIRLPAHYVFTRPGMGLAEILAGLSGLPAGCLLRLRLPDRSDADYRQLAAELVVPAREQGIALILDRDPDLVAELGAAGQHWREADLVAAERRPDLPEGAWLGASVHGAVGLELAALVADFTVLGSVQSTPTHPMAEPLGWERVSGLCGPADLPCYLIGGLGPSDLLSARQVGAQGVAGVSAYWSGSSGRP